MRKLVLVGALAGVLLSNWASAQSFFAMRRGRTLILNVGTGSASYFGELSNDGDYLQAKPNFSAGFQYYISHKISIRSELTWFQLSGTDSKALPESGRKERNLSFTENNFEFNAVGIIDLYRHGRSFYQRPALNFYAFGGIGLLRFNPTTVYQGVKYDLATLQTELTPYSRITPVIPMGLGMRFRVTPFMNISIEGGFRKTFTDYLDDVSTVHYAASKFSNPIAAALNDRGPEVGVALKPDGFIRGNPKTDDAYMLYSVRIEYYLPTNFFENNNSGQKTFKNRRKAFYRYNKRGGLKKR
ncbi:MAG TPA: DUF6089 family protein [Cyclobacteriaceae bacterium]|nr:DUF6089 family protein [Cyclobacteriaceae bacterium]